MDFTFMGHKFNSETKLVRGRDLRLMRIRAAVNTTDAATSIGVRSGKTIENWEAERCEPTIAVFIQLVHNYGFEPGLIVQACMKRALLSATDNQLEINLEACISLE